MKKEDFIQNYFKNTLSSKEKLEFSHLIESDADFKAKFEDYDNMYKAFKTIETKELKDFLNQIDYKDFKSKPSWYKNSVTYYAVAAILVIALCIPIFTKTSPNTLFTDYFETYPNVEQPVVRGNNDSKSTKVFQNYENNNFFEAAEGFKAMLKKEDNLNYRFYYAMSLLNDKKYNLALNELSKLETLDFDYKEETLWYSALILIKKDQLETAKQKLKMLDNLSSSFKFKERKVLLSKL